MSTEQKNILFDLIKSLSKSEKRQFKLFVGRLGANSDAKFIALFNVIDKMKKYDEQTILRKTDISKGQLPNVKSNLYRQLLVSLRLNPQHQTPQLQIREQIDFATILYNKGLYRQSLKILDKAKSTAMDLYELNMAFEIVEFEKAIESQYITRSMDSRADDLAVMAKDLSIQNVLASKLSNLSLQLYSFLLKNGYAKNEDDYIKTRNYFYYHLPTFEIEELDFREKLYLYMAQLWYNMIIQDFVSSYKYATKWVELFREERRMISANPVYYVKGYNYLLESLYYLRYYSKFKESYLELCEEVEHDKYINNANTKSMVFIYTRYNEINMHFLGATFEEGIKVIQRIEEELNDHTHQIDEHHIMVFYYKFACLHFGIDNYRESIQYLNKIINNPKLGMREDLLCYSRILRLICHFELGKEEIESIVKSTYRFLIKMNDLHRVQVEIIAFLKNLNNIYPSELKNAFKDLFDKLKKLEDHPYEKRSFLYLDILSWLESKIEGKPLHSIVQEKARALK
ncbi:MAG: hypothetical protein MI810_11915 [Flavobacteriales bacterium]|nr:hypothetical protein [Flavobacteriales bacterium]